MILPLEQNPWFISSCPFVATADDLNAKKKRGNLHILHPTSAPGEKEVNIPRLTLRLSSNALSLRWTTQSGNTSDQCSLRPLLSSSRACDFWYPLPIISPQSPLPSLVYVIRHFGSFAGESTDPCKYNSVCLLMSIWSFVFWKSGLYTAVSTYLEDELFLNRTWILLSCLPLIVVYLLMSPHEHGTWCV